MLYFSLSLSKVPLHLPLRTQIYHVNSFLTHLFLPSFLSPPPPPPSPPPPHIYSHDSMEKVYNSVLGTDTRQMRMDEQERARSMKANLTKTTFVLGDDREYQ